MFKVEINRVSGYAATKMQAMQNAIVRYNSENADCIPINSESFTSWEQFVDFADEVGYSVGFCKY